MRFVERELSRNMDVLVRVLFVAILCSTTLRVNGMISYILRRLQAASVEPPTFYLSLSPGIVFSRDGQSIPKNDMARISVNDFEVATSETDTNLALRCQWETPGLDMFTYSCHVPDGDGPIDCPPNNPNYINNSGDMITRGWSARRGEEGSGEDVIRIQYIWRRDQTAQEGYFTCYNFGGDTNDPVGLYILYPSEWPSLLTVIERCSVLYHSSSPPVTEVTAAIEVETGKSTFRVRCSSTGGRALDMAVSGPNDYYNISSSDIQPVGTRMYQGADSYNGSTEEISGGSNGDVYQCNVTNFASNFSSVTLRGNVLSHVWTLSLYSLLFLYSCCPNHHFTATNSSRYCHS